MTRPTGSCATPPRTTSTWWRWPPAVAAGSSVCCWGVSRIEVLRKAETTLLLWNPGQQSGVEPVEAPGFFAGVLAPTPS